ncbi:3D domain-containing protein [Aestuariivivens sediminicola]|uniref:3D domain-containing protein n=1 Tax=Aestuariivivens sediminicola TaxID=2913560 RepID=UPI001F5624CA|nr:3D domain-containing protein [Aestuariivivens sediminicola]
MLRYIIIIFPVVLWHCKQPDPYANYTWHALEVTATAYNSLSSQTDGDPHITAFGDSLVPGLPYIAVSRDLLKMGLKHNTPVKIEGLDQIYVVKDKMHSRWKHHIDIYMGLDVKAARAWGRKKISISYGVPAED